MKKEKWFSLRISEADRAALVVLTRFYNLSASAVICMLISRDYRGMQTFNRVCGKRKREIENEDIKSV